MPQLTSTYRSHTCAELRKDHEGSEVTLSGWILRKRDHGGVVFVDLRDNYGVTQVVFSDQLREEIQNTRVESVICVRGKVSVRDEETRNDKMETGQIEVQVGELTVLSNSDVLPFQIAEDDKAPESARLHSRFLELRREELHKNIHLRSSVIQAIRDAMHEEGFTEFQTPILTSSSPEGARDFIVPSRVHPGRFFALPQAPQQFKQLLMIAGFDRYFQVAPCFRDEDSRADRSPGEFYQLDMELSFVEQEDVLAINERIITKLFDKFSDLPMTKPWPRISYKDSLADYGTDKPDLRNPLKISAITDVFKDTEFRVFRENIDSGGELFAIKVPVDKVPPRKYFDEQINYFKKMSGQGLAYLVFEEEGHKGSIAKFMADSEIEGLREKLDIQPTSVVFFAAGKREKILPWVGRLRTKLGEDFNLIDKDRWEFCWIVDFPMFELDERTGKMDFSHNPFSMPRGGLDALNNEDPLTIQSDLYDVVCNGFEIASGAIRNHIPEIMYKAFEIVGYSKEDVDTKFGGMIRGFRYGAPPHGGIAHGIERIVMLLAGEEAIREVIPFPLSQTVEDLMMGAPSNVSPEQLKDVHIALDLPVEIEIEDRKKA